jgi:putative ABC transport system permease protein
MRTDVASAMKQETAVSLGGRGRFRDVLIAAQIAVCLVLLVGAGLLGRGVLQASHADPGFETKRVFMMYIPDAALGSTQAQRDTRMSEVARRLREVPQLTEISLARTPPMMGHGTANFEPIGSRVSMQSAESRAFFNMISPRYFETLGIPVLRGRAFTPQDVDQDAAVTVISEATAQRYWPGEEPLGKRISVWKGLRPQRISGRTYTVIGVVKSVRSTNLSKVDPGYIYFPGSYAEAPLFLVRTDLPSRAAMPLMRDAAAGTDRALGSQIMLMNVEAGPVQLQRLMTEAPALVAAVLGGLGMLLAAVGIYGVVAYLVSQRTREIGVRVALGASRGDVMSLVFRQALKPVMWGVPVGLAGSAMLSVLLSKMVVMAENPDPLFGANPWSPSTFVGVLAFLVLIVWVASWMPARRATRIDPAVALRYE